MARSAQHQLSFSTVTDLHNYIRWTPHTTPTILARRGAPPPDIPENSIAAYQLAWDTAPCWIEIDIRRTRDNRYVVCQDAALHRCTTGAGTLAEYTDAELGRLHLNNRRGHVTRHRMPSLDDVIDWACDRTILVLDIKTGVADFEPILHYLQDRNALRFSVIMTYSQNDAATIRSVEPDAVICGRATTAELADVLLSDERPGSQTVAWVHDIPPATYRRLHDRGIRTLFATFADVEHQEHAAVHCRYRELLDCGVDILYTDNVADAAAAISDYTVTPN